MGNKFTYLTIIGTFFGFACEEDEIVIPDFNGYKRAYGGVHEEYAYGATPSFDGGTIISGFSTTFKTLDKVISPVFLSIITLIKLSDP